MRFTQPFWDGLADGTITVAFRRWRRPTVKAGGRMRFARGVLGIDAVSRVTADEITEEDARRAGHASLSDLLAFLDSRPEGDLYRVDFHYAGEDERIALREDAALDDDARAALGERLARYDRASPRGPWTRAVLELIASQPGVRAPDLAASLGRDTLTFKVDVRKLKALGLTESLPVGYRLSPRGEAYLRG
jgi:hypothetical protein